MNILVVAAHPDDEVLGLGGTIARYTAKGHNVTLLMVTDGASTQYPNQPQMVEQKKSEMAACAGILGIRNIVQLDFPDMKLDTVPHVTLNNAITSVIETEKSEVVYTHFYGDINADHRAIFESTMVACRPSGPLIVKQLLCYNTPSSTEWSAQNPQNVFMPNMYVDTSPYLETKLNAMACYSSELRDYPHPRSLESISKAAGYWGQHIGVKAAEAFVTVRTLVVGDE